MDSLEMAQDGRVDLDGCCRETWTVELMFAPWLYALRRLRPLLAQCRCL